MRRRLSPDGDIDDRVGFLRCHDLRYGRRDADNRDPRSRVAGSGHIRQPNPVRNWIFMRTEHRDDPLVDNGGLLSGCSVAPGEWASAEQSHAQGLKVARTYVEVRDDGWLLTGKGWASRDIKLPNASRHRHQRNIAG